MKIIIIGASGMLGQDLVKEFKKNHQVVKWDRKEIDITKKGMVDKKISKLKPNAVINAAAFTDVDGCEEPKKKPICMKVNGYAPGYLAKTCSKLNIPLVHFSTDYIFNGRKKDGYKENYNKIDPINVYGQSKALGEKQVKENTKDFYIIRTAWLYGKNGKNFVDTMLQLAKKNDILKIVNDQYGKPTFTVDLARRTRIILEQKKKPGVYHITNEGTTTWCSFAKEIFKLAKANIDIQPCDSNEFPRPAKRPTYSALINTKLPKMRKWQTALKDYLTNY